MADGFAGGRGLTYEYRMCMLCVVRGYTRGLQNFKLRYQVPDSVAGKFDDVVFDEGDGVYQIFQLKHRENKKMKMSSSQLFSENFSADYSLLKYVKSLNDITSNDTLKGKVRTAAVITNIDFDLQQSNELGLVPNSKNWYKGLTCVRFCPLTLDGNAIFDTLNLFPNAKYYKFDNDSNIVHILKRQSETFSKELRQKLKKQEHTKIAKNDAVESQSKERLKVISGKNIKYENQHKELIAGNEALAKVLENLTVEDIKNALQHIVYAVQQPNDMGLEELIKDEIKNHFKLLSVDIVYNAFEIAMTKWCNTKEPLIEQINDPHIIQFRDADRFFQKNVKNVSFGENAPTRFFTGRKRELKLLREKLEEKHDLFVSQTIAINGLGGIGKTELTKQFIKEFGQSDFYGRVIWIEAESDESVEKCFRDLAEKVEIRDRKNKSITTLIDQIFDYFQGVKVLFVFDNFDKSIADAATSLNEKEKNLVIYCRKRARNSTKEHSPYFILTSRNKECLPGVFSLDLSVLTKEDANELIKKGLMVKNYTNQDVEELAKNLQYFPLALHQTFAYINKQDAIIKMSGGQYEIQNYLKEFADKTKEVLNYRYVNDFGEHERTTLVTWNVTFDAINRDEINGLNAITVLQFMSYLYADKIDAKMFLSLFDHDSTRAGEAFLLLEKYSMITKIGESTNYQMHRLVQSVVRLKFKDKQHYNFPKQVWKLIFPELYNCYFDRYKDSSRQSELMEQCSNDQLLHYHSLATCMNNKIFIQEKSFLEFLHSLHGSVLYAAILKDDIDKVITLQLSQEQIREFSKRNILPMIYKSKKVLKMFIENGYLGINELDLKMLNVIVNRRLTFFKYLVQLKCVNLIDLKFFSPSLILNIINGKSKLLLEYIESRKTEEHDRALKEALFFASLFNQAIIVELLIAYMVEPNYNFCEWVDYSPIIVAAALEYQQILKILVKAFDKPEFKDKVSQVLFDLLNEPYFSDKNCFEIVFKKYLELGGDINYQHDHYKEKTKYTFLSYVLDQKRSVGRFRIIQFLLDNGADDEHPHFSLRSQRVTHLTNKKYIEHPDCHWNGSVNT